MHDTIRSQELIRKGISLGRLGRYEEAIACFDKALEINPNFAMAWSEKGVCLNNLAKHDQAIECYNKSLEINPNELKPWFCKGVSLAILGKKEQAIACFDKALEINPNYAMAWSEKGLSLRYLDRKKEAIECYNKALEINPNYAKVWSDKGAILADLGKYEEAIECFDKALEEKPNDLGSLYRIGICFSKLQRYKDSIQFFDKCLDINRNDTSALYFALYWKGVSLASIGNHKEAIECFDKALMIDQNSVEVLRTKALSLTSIGNNKDAIESLNKALKKNPNDIESLYGKGVCLGILGNHKEAIECFDQAIRIDQNSSKVWKAKASSFGYLGNNKEASECFDQAIRIDPNDVGAWYGKGMALDYLGEYNESIKCYDRALQIDPNNEKARIAKARWILGKVNHYYDKSYFETAREWANMGYEFCKPDIKVGMATFLNQIGKSYEEQGDIYKAKDYYIEARELCPNTDPIWNHILINLGSLFGFKLGRLKDASAYFNQINYQLFDKADRLFEKPDTYGYLQFLLRRARIEFPLVNPRKALQTIVEEVIPKALIALENSKKDFTPRDRIGPTDYSITISNALSDYAQYLNAISKSDVDLGSLKKTEKLLMKAIEISPQFGKTQILCQLGVLKLSWAMKLNVVGSETGKQESLSKGKIAKDLVYDAIINLKKSLELAEKLSQKEIVAYDTASLGQCYSLLDITDDAEKLLKKGYELYDELISNIKVSNLRIDFDLYKNFNMSIGDLCWLFLSKKNQVEYALAYAEVAKAREILNIDVTKSQIGCKKKEECIDIINGLNGQLLVLNERYRDLHKQADIKSPDSLTEKLNDVDSKYVALFQKKREIEDEIWKECPDPGVILPKDPKDIVDRFIKLSNGASKNQHEKQRWALMEFTYLERQEELVVFLLDYTEKLSTVSFGLSNPDWYISLPKAIKSFREAMEKKSYEQAEKILLETSTRLRSDIIPHSITKTLEDLEIQQLLIVSDGILNNMPFELITDKGSPLDECWGIKYSLVRGFSMNHFSFQLQSNVINSAKGLIIGNPTNKMLIPKKEIYPFLNSNAYWFAGLPEAEIEAENIGKILYTRGGEPTILLNKKASEENFIKEANSNSYAFIHFAGHAMFDSHDPDQSFLLLNKNGTISEKTYANEIPAKIHLKDFPLVTLSSCESGVSEIKTGNEAFGLIRGFTLAGASNLLLSGWSVFDDSAKEFMEVFYSELFNKSKMSEAITQARMEILKRAENGQYKKKIKALHFAPFQLWGNPFRRMNAI
jgi:tetratricopeptide (TPR) repeat protein